MTNGILRHLRQQRPFETLEQEVFVGLQLAAERLMEPWRRELCREAGLSDVQYNVLRILRGAGAEGLRVRELAARLITRHSDVTRLVERLERRGLVGRKTDPGDGRAVRVQITAAGRVRIAPLDERANALLHELLGPLKRSRMEQLRDGLGDLLDIVAARAETEEDVRYA